MVRVRSRPGASDPATGPWFLHRPALTVLVIAAQFAAVLCIRLIDAESPDAYSLFYVLPVALAATAFGERGGVMSALVAVVLMIVSTTVRGVSYDAVGWATRVLPILLLGYLLGSAIDRARRSETAHQRAEHAALLHREAIEINDVLLQHMVAAKWSLEAGQVESARHAIAEAVNEAERLVSDLIRRAGMGERAEQVLGGEPHRSAEP